MILNEKDLVPAGDAQPATGSDDTSNNGTTSIILLVICVQSLLCLINQCILLMCWEKCLSSLSLMLCLYRWVEYVCMFVCICTLLMFAKTPNFSPYACKHTKNNYRGDIMHFANITTYVCV